jgi:hypothetical protein
VLAAWERFTAADLQALNAKLTAAGLQPIELGS